MEPKDETQGSEPRAEKTTVDEMISGLRGSSDAEEGHFTIDPSIARDKLKHFQLADPWSYILEVVQAAVLKGATAISARVEGDLMELGFDGAPFSRSDLAGLYQALLGERRTAASRALAELALACNAVMQLSPLEVEVTSGAGADQGTSRLLLRPGAEEHLEATGETLTGTRVRVRFRPRRHRRTALPGSDDALYPEEHLLRQRCRFAEISLTVNGTRIDEGFALVDGIGVTSLTEGANPFLAGFVPDLKMSVIHFVKDGVLITSRVWEEQPQGLVALVRADHLQKDLSQGGIVEDEGFARLLESLAGAKDRCLALLKIEAEASAQTNEPLCEWMQQLLRGAEPEASTAKEHPPPSELPDPSSTHPGIPMGTPRRVVYPDRWAHLLLCFNQLSIGEVDRAGSFLLMIAATGVACLGLLWLLAPIPLTLGSLMELSKELFGPADLLPMRLFIAAVCLGGVLIACAVYSISLIAALNALRNERKVLTHGQARWAQAESAPGWKVKLHLDGEQQTGTADTYGHPIACPSRVAALLLGKGAERRLILPEVMNATWGPSLAEERHLCALTTGTLATSRWGWPPPEPTIRRQRRFRRLAVAAVVTTFLLIPGLRQGAVWFVAGTAGELGSARVERRPNGGTVLVITSTKSLGKTFTKRQTIDPRTGRILSTRVASGVPKERRNPSTHYRPQSQVDGGGWVYSFRFDEGGRRLIMVGAADRIPLETRRFHDPVFLTDFFTDRNGIVLQSPDGLVVAHRESGALVFTAIEVSRGKLSELWSVRHAPGKVELAHVCGGVLAIIVGAPGHYLLGLDARSGKTRWRRQI